MDPNKIIPTPCHENWNTMPGTDHKRFCDKCDHHVHDITNLNFTQIDKLRAKNDGKLCGVIRLSRNIALTAGIATLAACENTHEVLGECPPPQSLTDTLPKKPPTPEPEVHMGIMPQNPQPNIPPTRMGEIQAPLEPTPKAIDPKPPLMGKIRMANPEILMGDVGPTENISED